jgi:hypothetical protein
MNRRGHARIIGPFDGRRLDALETPVRIYDLSEGGCFMTSFQDPDKGRQFTVKIDLPDEGWITVKVETLYAKPDFGFAVRFVDLSDEVHARLARALARLRGAALTDTEKSPGSR